MEPNENLVRGKFLKKRPSSGLSRPPLTDLVLIIGILLFYYAFRLDSGMMSTHLRHHDGESSGSSS
jgi:hypothetical protein